MKKSKDIDDFIKWLEEAVDGMQDEGGVSKRPIFIDISINLCPVMDYEPADFCVQRESKVPVDVLETEKNIHAVVGLAGMKKEDIRLICTGKTLEISNEQGTLKEIIELPAKVNRTGMRTTYENGVLEVVFNKSKKRVKKNNY
ncbi:MAG: hypothetical protein OIN66_14380 [Candidatus Methanoperedens sp.]|nr:hypothetical protein [Candidatus Methanoperedens sp.]